MTREKLLKASRTLFALCVFASSLFFAGSVFFARRESGHSSYLVISSRSKALDVALVDLSQRSSHLTYIRSDDPFGRNYLTYFSANGYEKAVRGANLVLVESSKATRPIVDPTEIGRVIGGVHSEEFAADKFPYLVGLCLGLAFGIVLSKLPMSFVGGLAGLGVLVMVFKFATRCLTCCWNNSLKNWTPENYTACPAPAPGGGTGN